MRGSPSYRQQCRRPPCKVSIKQCMLACRNWCGFGGCWASCRWLCANPHHFSWTVRMLKIWLSIRCSKRSKHVAITYHRVPEHVDPDGEYGTATLIYVMAKDQAADIFTKSLTDKEQWFINSVIRGSSGRIWSP